MIETVRGKGGGIRLARDPAEIRIGAIVRAAEGEGPIVECLSDHSSACPITPICRLTRVLVEGFDALYDHLDRYTLADLVGNRRALAAVLVDAPGRAAKRGAARAPAAR